MRRPTSMPMLVQVAALVAAAVVLSQAVTFAVVVLSPEPRPAGFTIAAAAEALAGREAETSDGRTLKRRIVSVAPGEGRHGFPLAPLVREALAERLEVAPDRVRVWSEAPPPRQAERRVVFAGRADGPPPPPAPPPPPPEAPRMNWEGRTSAPAAPPAPPPAPAPPPVNEQVRIETHVFEQRGARLELRAAEGFTVLADRATFAPFSAAVRMEDGRWAVVEPPRSLLSPWQVRTLLTLAISLLLLAPLVWWMARRLTRPIRAFAEAAERLGADPEAAPMQPSGPQEVRTAIHAFNDMQAALKDHIRRRTQTIAAIAHDLRTPLTRLRFRAEQAPDALRDRMADDIEEMDALIAQAMRYVRGERAAERRERFDLAALARDVADGFIETGASAVFASAGPLEVQADPAALRRALGNLVDNALSFGGAVRVEAARDGERAVITVEDDGPGLAEDQLEAVFEPFARGERSRSRETGGAGLGLTVARQAARAHGGDVILTNRATGGLSARLWLPAVAD